MPSDMKFSVRVNTVRPRDAAIDGVIALADQNWKKLGFVPAEALRKAAGENAIIAATDGHGFVLGYVWYSVTRSVSEARIHHLCVDQQYRGSGVGRRLVDEVKDRTKDLRGIVLRCRRDYEDSCKFWRRVGFVPFSEITGRGRDGTVLTCFRFDHGQPDLWTGHYTRLAEDKAVVVLDANVFFDLADESSPSHKESLALQADWISEYAALWVTDELYSEIDRKADAVVRSHGRGFARGFPSLKADRTERDQALDALNQILPPAVSDSDRSDRTHLATAAAATAEFFITRDRVLLEQAPRIGEELQLNVVTPLEFILSIDQIQRGWYYQPARLAGSCLTIQTISAADASGLSEGFLNYGEGERKAEFESRLRLALGAVRQTHGYVVRDADRGRGLLVLSGKPGRPHEIVFLRIARSALGPTLACHLVFRAVQLAIREGAPAVILADARCPEFVQAACHELGFVPTGDRLAKINVKGLVTLDGANKELAELGAHHAELGGPVAALVNAISVARSLGSQPAELAHIERLLWPMKLEDDQLAAFMVPIAAEWAKHLFEERLAEQHLFPADTSLSLQYENVYYRSAHPRILKAPGRVLWYVGASTSYDGTAQIRACSRIEEVVVGPAKALFKRFSRLGVFSWQNVLNTAGQDPDGNLMAFRFAATELLPQPIPMQEVRRVLTEERGVTPQFTTALKLSRREFALLYTIGTGEPAEDRS